MRSTTFLSVLALTLLFGIWWTRNWNSRVKRDGPEMLLDAALPLLPNERRDWGAAMNAELAQLSSPSSRWSFALGCAWVALFPPRRSGVPVVVIGILSVLTTVVTSLIAAWVLPTVQVFAVTFVALVGALATFTVARSHKPSLAASGTAATFAMLVGVAGCIGIYI